MLNALFHQLSALFFSKEPEPIALSEAQLALLNSTVDFYRGLTAADKTRFEHRCSAFISVTEFIGHDIEVSELDTLLIAASSVILAWGFDKWHFVKVDTVYLVSGSFNENSEFQNHDSNITGLVGTHHLSGKMILSQPALHQGFANEMDKQNVAIHEFAHLIDMADGDIDGLPSQLSEHSYALPWFDLVAKKISHINSGKSDIRDYGRKFL